jgi:hypothetical protein
MRRRSRRTPPRVLESSGDEMKCKSHKFAADGRCSTCGKRRPGRPKRSLRSPKESEKTTVADPAEQTLPAAPPAEPDRPPSAGTSEHADRINRMRAMFVPAPAPAPPATEAEGDPVPIAKQEPEPEAKRTIPLKTYDWKWASLMTTEGIDVGAGWAIGRWSDLQPLEASESSRKRFAETLAVFGEQRLGKVEAPTWIVLVICLISLVISKIVDAPSKAEILAAKAREVRPVTAAPPASASPAATSGQGAASGADNPASPPPASIPFVPQIVRPPMADDNDGSAPNAPIGF